MPNVFVYNDPLVGEPLIGFPDAMFLPSQACFPPHFIKIVVEVKAFGPAHVLKLWLGINMDMLHVEYFCSNNANFLCQLNFMKIM